MQGKKKILGLFVSFCLVSQLAQLGLASDWQVYGFVENLIGVRAESKDDLKRSKLSVGELRGQLRLRSDLTKPALLQDWYAQLQVKFELLENYYWQARSGVDVREFLLSFSPFDWLDVKMGRQILTWGVGTYVFVNDLFPKDYISFYLGRDQQYLKLPSDAVRFSIFGDELSLDLVWIVNFRPNQGPEGYYLSSWDPYLQKIVGQQSISSVIERGWRDTEFALRFFGNLNGYEWALYYFDGFYKNPVGFLDQSQYQLYYPSVRVYGLSLRGPFVRGIAAAEFGFYYSVEDKYGTKRTVPNSQWKLLLSYETDFKGDLNFGLQFLIKRMHNYQRYIDSLLPGDIVYERWDYMFTFQITKSFYQQRLHFESFLFYDVTYQSTYLRLNLGYDLTDNWKITVGANLIDGSKRWDEIGQMQENDNVFLRVRYSF